MRFAKLILPVLMVVASVGCKHGKTDNNKTYTFEGRLRAKGTTPYNYGTHVVFVSTFEWYLLESTSISLDAYTNDSVTVVAKDMGIKENSGPELYNVISITPH